MVVSNNEAAQLDKFWYLLCRFGSQYVSDAVWADKVTDEFGIRPVLTEWGAWTGEFEISEEDYIEFILKWS